MTPTLTFFENIKLYVGFTDASSAALRELHPIAAAVLRADRRRLLRGHRGPPGARAGDHRRRRADRAAQADADPLDGQDAARPARRGLLRAARAHRPHARPHRAAAGVHVHGHGPDPRPPARRPARPGSPTIRTRSSGSPPRSIRSWTSSSRSCSRPIARICETKHRNAERLATIGQFAASIGHELRNPLGVVESSLYLLRQHLGEQVAGQPQVAKHLDRIGSEVQRANRTIHDLLDLARNRPPRRHRTASARAGRERRGGGAAAGGDHPRCRDSAGSDRQHRPRPGPADPGQPADQRRPGDARARPRSGWRPRPPPTGARACACATTVPAFRPQDRHRVFEALFTTKAKGSGLGLALCRRIMEAHGGTIELEATATGASFLLTFPLRKADDVRRRAGMTGLVLIVDDDEALSENLAEIVGTPRRRRRSIARDRETALSLAAAHDFDVALIDVRLPDGDGMSLLAPLRARSPFLQSVMVTGNASVEGAIAAVRGAAFAYVLKPVSPPDLLDTTRRALEQAALYRERERLRERARTLRGDAIASWSSRSPRSCSRSTRRARSRPGIASSNASPATRGPRCSERTGGGSSAPDAAPGRPPGQGRRQAQGSLAPLRGEGAGRRTDRLRRRHRRHRRRRDAPPAAAFRAAGRGRDHGRRPGARGAQPAQLGVAAAHRARAAPRSQRRSGRQPARSRASSRARSIASTAWCASSSRSRSPHPLETKAGRRRRAARRRSPDSSRPRRRPRRSRSTSTRPAARRPCSATASGCVRCCSTSRATPSRRWPSAAAGCACAARAAGAEVEIDVEDDGPGFGEELPVFDAFFTTKAQGTGLGLAIVHRIVADHGGTIRVESRPGRTCFTLALPAASVSVSASARNASTAVNTPTTCSSLTTMADPIRCRAISPATVASDGVRRRDVDVGHHRVLDRHLRSIRAASRSPRARGPTARRPASRRAAPADGGRDSSASSAWRRTRDCSRPMVCGPGVM